MRAKPIVLLLILCACQPAAPTRVAGPQPFCTRTLGTPECFAYPFLLPDHPTPLLDTPVRPAPPAAPWWQTLIEPAR